MSMLGTITSSEVNSTYSYYPDFINMLFQEPFHSLVSILWPAGCQQSLWYILEASLVLFSSVNPCWTHSETHNLFC